MKRMRILAGLVLMAGAACVRTTPTEPDKIETPEQRSVTKRVQRAFEGWREALLDGDAEGALERMSSQMIADWIYQRMSDRADTRFQVLRESLDESTRIDLDAWYRRNDQVRPDFATGRPFHLPETVLASRWLRAVWNEYFQAELPTMRQVAEVMEVGTVYPDGPAATVYVKIAGAQAKGYEMVVENGEWKLNYTIRKATPGAQ